MLIQFKVENYKSFNKEQTLSMKAGASKLNNSHIYETEKLSLLKSAVIFGSNASGKSNLVKAMIAVKNLITLGYPIPPSDYCRTDKNNADKPSSFEFTITLDDEKFDYGLEIVLSTGTIKSEWLKNLSTSKFIFKRFDNEIETDLKLENCQKYFDVYSAEAKNNTKTPFLRILSRMNYDNDCKLIAANKLFIWFINKLRIIMPYEPTGFSFTKEINEFNEKILPEFGTGITGVEYRDLTRSENFFPQDLLNNIARDLKNGSANDKTAAGFIEGGVLGKFPVTLLPDGNLKIQKMMYSHDSTLFEYYEESEGTNRLFDLLPILNPGDEKDLVYVVDELDRSLHPQLTKKFVEDFEKLDNKLKRQLIITTHESRLMDLNLLRRDEIWFVDKNDGLSELYSLEEYNERTDKKIDKAYLDGRYGAVPCFKKIYPDLE